MEERVLNLLIVDDEEILLDDLKSGVDWEKIGVTQVFCAGNIIKAKEMFALHNISVLLCDIEMPQGNGLELLSWVNENYGGTETIFLTCHADFNYAIEAIRLGSLDYLLKPISYEDLEKVILKAIRKKTKEFILSDHVRIGQYWSKHQLIVIEHFWLDIINGNILPKAENISEAASERNIPFLEDLQFLPVLIKIRRYRKTCDLREQKQVEFSVKDCIEGEVLKSKENGLVLQLGSGNFILIFYQNDIKQTERDILVNSCDVLIELCKGKYCSDVNTYIGNFGFAQDIASKVEDLLLFDKNNIAFENKTFLVDEALEITKQALNLDFMMWTTMLLKGESEKVYLSICRQLDEAMKIKEFGYEALSMFQVDFMQMIFTVLKEKKVEANKVLSDDVSVELYTLANRSITDLKAWVKHICDKIKLNSKDFEAAGSIIEKAKLFIKKNLNQDINRMDIAAHLHINHDYFSRLFGKEVGISIPEYIMQERLKIAREMILNTEMSVSEIAANVGYTNFSYFSKLFKEMFGISPTMLKNVKIDD